MEEELHSPRRAHVIFAVLIIVSISLLAAHLTLPVRALKHFVYYIVNPTPVAASRALQSGQYLARNLRDLIRVNEDNIRLRSTIRRYSYLDAEYRRMKEENLRLQAVVGFKPPPGRSAVAARIVSREPSNWFQSALIDRGSASGLKEDQPVIAFAHDRPAVLGRIGDVYANTARVILITSPLSAVPVHIRALSEDGLLEGQNTGRLRMNYIMPEGVVSIGDDIVTSALSSVFPEGISIGQVLEVLNAKDDPMRSAVIKPALDFNHLREVIVLIPENQ